MAKKSLKVKCARRKAEYLQAISQGKKPVMPTKVYNRCKLCGRSKGYIRKFDICRICLRELANKGEIMGLRKSSW